MITQSVYLVKCLELSIYKALGLFVVSKLSLKYQDKERASKNWQIFAGTFKVPTTKIGYFRTFWQSHKFEQISMSQSHYETGETHAKINSFSASLDFYQFALWAHWITLTLFMQSHGRSVFCMKAITNLAVTKRRQSPLLRPPLRGGSLLTSSL